ncbi:ArsR family transcriptional regulator [Natribaculum luteum]|uniref:ArsR family transcriptional regulator n=1 Tax=Natribaculum luteum TaxID=1586232 RepID=A0ABD5P5J0_9EURY|nr:ArsR family transcriptional regulator [Natribaculum luteum]
MGGEADWGTMFEALKNVYRRRLLVELFERNPQEDRVIVPEGVHAGEKELSALQTKFVHTHLPLLEQAGYVTWDRESHEVTRGPEFDEIRPFLELIEDHRDELPSGWI